jgi:hypothetical protein
MTRVNTPAILVHVIDPALNLFISLHVIITFIENINDFTNKCANGFPKGQTIVSVVISW